MGAVNVDEQAQIQLLALSLKELIQSSAMTALDQLFVFLAVIMRSLGEIRCHGGNRITRKDELTPDYARKDELTPDYALSLRAAHESGHNSICQNGLKVLLRVTVRPKKRDSSAISSGVAALKSAESTPVRDCPGLLAR